MWKEEARQQSEAISSCILTAGGFFFFFNPFPCYIARRKQSRDNKHGNIINKAGFIGFFPPASHSLACPLYDFFFGPLWGEEKEPGHPAIRESQGVQEAHTERPLLEERLSVCCPGEKQR